MTVKLREDRISWRQLDGEVVAVNIENSTYVSTNGSGAVLWLELAQGTTRERLVERLAQAYGIDHDRAASDVDNFLDELRAQGLLEAS